MGANALGNGLRLEIAAADDESDAIALSQSLSEIEGESEFGFLMGFGGFAASVIR